MDDREELVFPKDLSINDVIFEDLSVLNTQNGPMTRSVVRRTYDDGKPGTFLLGLPKQFCFGLSKKYEYGKERTVETWTGDYQIAYSVTSLKTIKKPSADEQALFDACETLEQKLANFIFDNKEQLGGTYEAVSSPEEVRRLKLVKPILTMPTMEGPAGKGGKPKKVYNPEKPYTLYVNVMRNKKRNTFTTRLFGPGDVEIKPLTKIEDVNGDLEPVVFLSHIHFGAKASFQFKLWDGNFTPRESFGPRRRLIGKNTAPPQEIASRDEDGGHGGEEEERVVRVVSKPKPSETSNPVNDLGSASEGEGDAQEMPTHLAKDDPAPVVVGAVKPKKKLVKKRVTQEESAE